MKYLFYSTNKEQVDIYFRRIQCGTPVLVKLEPFIPTTTCKYDVENASIFDPHFYWVFNNHRQIDWPVLYKISQKEVTEELDPPISWAKKKIYNKVIQCKSIRTKRCATKRIQGTQRQRYHLASDILQ